MKAEITNELRRRPKSLSAGALSAREVWCKNLATSSADLKKHSLTNMGGSNNKVFVDKKKKDDMDSYLVSDKVLKMIGYFNYSSIISNGLDDYLQGNIRGKLEKSSLTYDSVLTYFSWLIFLRNLLLAFIEDLTIRAYLGETERIRPERQLVMVLTIWSIYVALVFTVYSSSTKWRFFSWLSPFQALRGHSTPKSHGLDSKMTELWYDYTLSLWRKYLTAAYVRWILGLLFLIWLIFHRWTPIKFVNTLTIIWAILMIIWTYYSSNVIYISYIYFNSLCFYFRTRYQKVNDDIDSIISTSNRMKSPERTQKLHHVLNEHNQLCLKIAEYNRFWAKYLMSTYFFLVAIICFTVFQAFFTANRTMIRVIMFLVACESAFILTKISISAALLSNTAHASYNKLIRVTFDKYPVELQIQIVAALGQNFLLIVDFVRSYAEVGKEHEDTFTFSEFTESVFNTTLSAIGVISNDIGLDDNESSAVARSLSDGQELEELFRN